MIWVLVSVVAIGVPLAVWMLRRVPHTGTPGDASERAQQVLAEVETFTGGSSHEPWDGQRRLEDPRELY